MQRGRGESSLPEVQWIGRCSWLRGSASMSELMHWVDFPGSAEDHDLEIPQSWYLVFFFIYCNSCRLQLPAFQTPSPYPPNAEQRSVPGVFQDGKKKANYWGSICMASTVRLGNDASGNAVYVPLRNLLPMLHPDDLVIGGWDICGDDLGTAMGKASVLVSAGKRCHPL